MLARTTKLTVMALGLALLPGVASAETASYGRIDLEGLSRNVDWPINTPGPSNSMVCNVNGPDGFVTVRSGPGTHHSSNRQLRRLAIIEVDTRQRRGRWVRVLTADRTHTTNGQPQAHKSLHVTGWVHDNYLCGYTDY